MFLIQLFLVIPSIKTNKRQNEEVSQSVVWALVFHHLVSNPFSIPIWNTLKLILGWKIFLPQSIPVLPSKSTETMVELRCQKSPERRIKPPQLSNVFIERSDLVKTV